MDLERLRIDRSAAPRRARAGGRAIRRIIYLVVLGAALFLFRAPILRAYDRVTLPIVRVTEAVKTTPAAASAAAGISANGYIVAARRAALSADTPGRVVEMNVEEGTAVRKGDVVARLFADEYRAAVRRAQAELDIAKAAEGRLAAEVAAARARLETARKNVDAAAARVEEAKARAARAKTDYDRAAALVASGAGTQQETDDAQTELDRAVASRNAEEALLVASRGRVAEGEADIRVAEASLAEAAATTQSRKAALEEQQAILGKTEVKAPFDGVVVLKDAEVGEVVSPNAQGGNSRGAVVTMVDFASLEAQVDMPERSLGAITTGKRARVFLDAYPDHGYEGRVDRIWPTANRQKGTVELRVKLDGPDDRLRPEMGVRVVFLDDAAASGAAAAEEPVVLVPETAVVRADGATGVFELDRDVARWRAVDLGERRGDRLVVRRGLSGGERLVDDPSADLRDGARVRVAE
ncbi:MAG TPA: efflux RND transporter periplasmic adaptor subunit [Planctomycetota bacterium]|nr:efflux RND transporter periplasmic adaptor subunit [Planctomycetota bacterium]